jgi:hypothetical protein
VNRATRRELSRGVRLPRDQRVFRKRPGPRVGERLEHRRLATNTHGQPATRTSIPPAQSYLQIERG